MNNDEMTSILIMDGVKYKLWVPEIEEEFEDIVKEHSKEIFGNDTLYIDLKKRITSKSGIMAHPDGYLIDFSNNSFWVVEIELSTHPLHKHLIEQLSRFISGIKNPETQKKIADELHSAIKSDIVVESFVKKKIVSEDIHHYVSKLITEDLPIIIVINELNDGIKEACESLKAETYFVELKTFVRENTGIGAHIHSVKFPSDWEKDILPYHAIYDEERKVFLCNCGGEAHKNSSTYNVGEIVEHLWLAHGIPPDEQVIDGWDEEKHEKEYKKYFAKKYI